MYRNNIMDEGLLSFLSPRGADPYAQQMTNQSKYNKYQRKMNRIQKKMTKYKSAYDAANNQVTNLQNNIDAARQGYNAWQNTPVNMNNGQMTPNQTTALNQQNNAYQSTINTANQAMARNNNIIDKNRRKYNKYLGKLNKLGLKNNMVASQLNANQINGTAPAQIYDYSTYSPLRESIDYMYDLLENLI